MILQFLPTIVKLKNNSFTEEENGKFVDAVINFISLELVEVKTLQNQGKGSEAANKYMDLWRTVDSIISIKNTSVYYAMLYSYIVSQMGEYSITIKKNLKNIVFHQLAILLKIY